MLGHTIRHKGVLNTIIEGTSEGNIPQGRLMGNLRYRRWIIWELLFTEV